MGVEADRPAGRLPLNSLRKIFAISGEGGMATLSKIHDIFLCHDTRDKARYVEPLYQAFTARGYGCFLDSKNLGIGDRLTEMIEANITFSRILLVVASPHTVLNLAEQKWVKKEVDHARAAGVQIQYAFPGGPEEFAACAGALGVLDPPPNNILSSTKTDFEEIVDELGGQLPLPFGGALHMYLKRELAEYSLSDKDLQNLIKGMPDGGADSPKLSKLRKAAPVVDEWWSHVGASLLSKPRALRLVKSALKSEFDFPLLDTSTENGILEFLFAIAVQSASKDRIWASLLEALSIHSEGTEAEKLHRKAYGHGYDSLLRDIRKAHTRQCLWDAPDSPQRLVLWVEHDEDDLMIFYTVEEWDAALEKWDFLEGAPQWRVFDFKGSLPDGLYEAAKEIKKQLNGDRLQAWSEERICWVEYCLYDWDSAKEHLEDLKVFLERTKKAKGLRKLFLKKPFFLRSCPEIDSTEHLKFLTDRFDYAKSLPYVSIEVADSGALFGTLLACSSDVTSLKKLPAHRPIWTVIYSEPEYDHSDLSKRGWEFLHDHFNASQYAELRDVLMGWEQFPPPCPLPD